MSEEETVRIYRIPKWMSWRTLAAGVLIVFFGGLLLRIAVDYRYRLPIWFFPIFITSGSFLLLMGTRNLSFWWYAKKSALVVSEDGIRNDDPARPNVIPWDDIREIRPRPLLNRMDVFSSRPFKPIRIPHLLESFEEAASEVALKTENPACTISDQFNGDSYYLPPILIKALFFISEAAYLCVATVLVAMSFPDRRWLMVIPVAVFPSLANLSRTRRPSLCQSLTIRPVLLALSTSSGDPLLSLREIESIYLTSVPDGPGVQTLDVKVRMKDGKAHYVSPRGVNPLDVFSSVHAAWEKYNQRIGTGESRSGAQSVSTHLP